MHSRNGDNDGGRDTKRKPEREWGVQNVNATHTEKTQQSMVRTGEGRKVRDGGMEYRRRKEGTEFTFYVALQQSCAKNSHSSLACVHTHKHTNTESYRQKDAQQETVEKKEGAERERGRCLEQQMER